MNQEIAEKMLALLPEADKEPLVKDFGICAEPLWIFHALTAPLTDAGMELFEQAQGRVNRGN